LNLYFLLLLFPRMESIIPLFFSPLHLLLAFLEQFHLWKPMIKSVGTLIFLKIHNNRAARNRHKSRWSSKNFKIRI
jgi:hypothetical protein